MTATTRAGLAQVPGVAGERDVATRGFVFNHTMLRIKDPQASLDFYTRVLGFTLVRRIDFAEAKFSLFFLVLTDDPGAIPDDDAARKQWLADHLQLAGKLVLDAGAVKALHEGRSLLPVGVKAVDGEFERGAAVACLSPDGHELARGLANYASSEARLIAGKTSGDDRFRASRQPDPHISLTRQRS